MDRDQTGAEFAIQKIDNLRKNSKGEWYSTILKVGSHIVKVKGYKTWLQILNVDGVSYSGAMDISVKEFRHHLVETFELTFLDGE